MKILFYFLFSFFGLIYVLPAIFVLGLLVKIDSPGPVFYLAKRAGKGGKEFKMIKFRSMVTNADRIGGPSTSGDDPRLTRAGKFLRSHNFDELPQLINILKGEMSFVGPRPEVPSEVATYDEETKRIILSVRPGMTDLATLANIHEEEILRGAKDPHEAYRRLIQPQKLRLAREYVQTRSFWLDLKIIFRTLKSAIF
ncbi:MAG: sugar transferase [Candidatus Nealsonbacteria bacterium]|nr:sugar transferase [Candidatus Nealsonbacteria bacterium]